MYPGVLYDPTTYACFSLLQKTSDQGSRVCLWGTGGDEVLTPGPSYLAALLRYGRIAPFVRQLRYAAGVCSMPAWKFAWNYCARPAIPSAVKSSSDESDDRSPVTTAALDRFETSFRRPFRLPGSDNEGEGFSSLRSASSMPPHRGLAAWHAARTPRCVGSFQSAEFRHPFLDRRLVEFVMRVPDRHKVAKVRPRLCCGTLCATFCRTGLSIDWEGCLYPRLTIGSCDAIEGACARCSSDRSWPRWESWTPQCLIRMFNDHRRMTPRGPADCSKEQFDDPQCPATRAMAAACAGARSGRRESMEESTNRRLRSQLRR